MSTASYLTCDQPGCSEVTPNDGTATVLGWHKGGSHGADYCRTHAPREASAMAVNDAYLRSIEASAEHVLSMCKAIREGKAKHVLNLIRETRGGKLNDPNFVSRMRGQGPYAELLRKRFRLACARLGLNKNDWNPNLSLFAVPPRPGDQLKLLL